MDTPQNTSRSREGLGMTLSENLDYIVELADAALVESPAARRPQHVSDKLQRACNAGQEHRLVYRPQPVPSQIEGFESA
jgi:hypothetical protein